MTTEQRTKLIQQKEWIERVYKQFIQEVRELLNKRQKDVNIEQIIDKLEAIMEKENLSHEASEQIVIFFEEYMEVLMQKDFTAAAAFAESIIH